MGAPARASFRGFLLAAAFFTTLGVDACPSPAWIPFQRSCYALMQQPYEVYSLDDARELCQGKTSGADIISINSKDENAFIQRSFRTHWHGPDYITLGMFFDTDDDTFKWFDDSKVNFTNWIEEETNNELLNTCATMHTVSGGWEKTSCDHLPLTGILCETIVLYKKTQLLETAWTTTIVITSTIIVSVSAAVLWFVYQRKVSSGTRCTIPNIITQVLYRNEPMLIDKEDE